ncbi:MAG: YceI family protein [Alphaproteobacteria bacterium]|nr:YceI family protein [Alphaproteobacteria bacterium]MBU1515339.1 YceI family protein [Alphaproteobacteria bacterium]MBU2095389.1 YceI family protein [Alphaproteobacteria bacterium]MBU2152591.1 YceI family protein [Alphaproteobacteria bacterium]MBU2309987.1 YceI family protein [Alphaproteobacteria bacterium]
MALGVFRLSRRLLIALALAICPAVCLAAGPGRDPARAPAGLYALDPRRATLALRVPYLGGVSASTVRFARLTGSFAYDPETWRATRVSIIVDPASAASQDGAMGRRVASALEPAKYPAIQFNSTSLESDADGRGQLKGALTLHGVTRPVTLDIVFKGVGPETRLGFSGRGRVKRSEFGVTAARPFVGDMLDLAFEVEFARK